MTEEIRIGVTGMTCASCVARVERAIKALPGVLSASVNLSTEAATVRYLPDTLSPEGIVAAIGAAGYTPIVPAAEPPGGAAPDLPQSRQAAALAGLRRDLGVAVVFTVPLLLLSMGPMLLHGLGPWLGWAP
ncbi:cation transporter, partial [uncultured Lamprocystis sp.]|uniref:cation transporter n=1 Tax=uncultured Lamprocystis sp. TaxID=543132 RepID=UPI0025F117CE